MRQARDAADPSQPGWTFDDIYRGNKIRSRSHAASEASVLYRLVT
jgi:hypothetical protein